MSSQVYSSWRQKVVVDHLEMGKFILDPLRKRRMTFVYTRHAGVSKTEIPHLS